MFPLHRGACSWMLKVLIEYRFGEKKWADPALEKYLEEKFSVTSPRSLYNSL